MKCPECGSVTKEVDGPIHEYMISSPGCWNVFCNVLNKEYSDPNYMKVHRLTVDAYRWNGDGFPKAWYIDVEEEKLQPELHYLRSEVFRREVGWE